MIPSKPFDTYKWRSFSVAPTESLLEPPVLLGVLRVLSRHEGKSPGAPQIISELKTVQDETGLSKRPRPVILSRTGKRNLIRNSGQYWKGTGLLAPISGEVQLTNLGRRVAEGRITQGEFAAIIIQQAVLPNPWVFSADEIKKWQDANLTIRPFALILEVIEDLGFKHGGSKEAYITVRELIKILIPLAGTKASYEVIAEQIARHRRGALDISAWPNCVPEDNDDRMAREFLLFLSNFGICRREKGARLDERYYLDELFDVAAVAPVTTSSIFGDNTSQAAAVEAIRHSALPSIIDRQRTTTTTTKTKRPGQAKFRKDTFKVYCGQCFLTGEKIPEVLEAAHIIPVEHGGADHTNNSICLRVDIHRLFDSGNLRLKPSGDLMFSDIVTGSKSYGALPSKIIIPGFVNPANIAWRDNYY